MFPLSPLDSPHQPLFMGQGCVLSPAQKGGGSHVQSSFFMLHFCFSDPVHLKWGHLTHREMHLPDFFRPGAPFFCGVVFLFAMKICCAGNAVPVSALSGICEGRRKKDFINFRTQALCSCPFLTSFDTSQAHPQLELAGISWLVGSAGWWVPALASY